MAGRLTPDTIGELQVELGALLPKPGYAESLRAQAFLGTDHGHRGREGGYGEFEVRGAPEATVGPKAKQFFERLDNKRERVQGRRQAWEQWGRIED